MPRICDCYWYEKTKQQGMLNHCLKNKSRYRSPNVCPYDGRISSENCEDWYSGIDPSRDSDIFNEAPEEIS